MNRSPRPIACFSPAHCRITPINTRRAWSRKPSRPCRRARLQTSRAVGGRVTPPAGAVENSGIDILMHRLCNPVDGPLYRRLLDAGCLPPRWRHETWREAGLLVLAVDPSDERVA